MNEQPHDMVLEKIHASGVQEWGCPVCGRRFLVQWPPEFNMIILEPGDQSANHSGSTGPLQMGPVSFNKGDGSRLAQEKRLDPWQQWMEDVDFDKWWNDR
jgi:hypothetical protein